MAKKVEQEPKSDLEKCVEAWAKFEAAIAKACIDASGKIEEGLRKIWKK